MDLKQANMKDVLNIKSVEKIKTLNDEHDLQKASLLERKLRLMIDENPGLKPIRNKLRSLIKEYEDRVWSDFDKVTDSLIEVSDKAEESITCEQRFVEKRKSSIRKRLKELDMNQQDLGVLLGHSKSYMSELMNGVSQFTMKDLVIIHRVLGIRLTALIPTYLHSETREKVRESIKKLNKSKLGLRRAELI